MNQESNAEKDMRPEYDMRGGVRGKYFERYRRWTSITSASVESSTGAISAMSTGTLSTTKITTVVSYQVPHLSPQIRFPRPDTFGAHAS